MHLTRADVWALSLGGFFSGWLALPALRPLFGAGLLLHIPPFVWGIADLRSGFFCPALTSLKPGSGKIALTFDDGPDPGITGEILDLLGRFGYTATFFVIAEKVKLHPELVRRIVDEGHIVGCHDLDHRWTANFRRSKALSHEIGLARTIISSATGLTPLLYRPPVGLVNPHTASVLKHFGMQCIGWSRRAADAGNRRADRLARIPGLAHDGSVVLLHDGLPRRDLKPRILQTIEGLFTAVRERGLYPVGIDRMFDIKAYQPAIGATVIPVDPRAS